MEKGVEGFQRLYTASEEMWTNRKFELSLVVLSALDSSIDIV
jgi:hypothetical protein